MYDELTEDDVSAEQKVEIEAAYGEDALENGDVVEIDTDALEPAESPEFVLPGVLQPDDWVTIQHKGGNVTTGPVTEVDSVGFTMDPRNRTTSGYFGYGDFVCEGTDERGVVNELLDINGEPAEQVISERLDG